jgi:pectinesterase
VNEPDAFFTSPPGLAIADNVVGWQNPNGGWFKNYDPTQPRPANILDDPKSGPAGDDDSVWHRVSTFDNSATYSEMRVLARAYRVLKKDAYRRAFDRGLEYIFESQYPNGGWPQRFPLQNNYGRTITFNDDAITGVMILLEDIVHQKHDFAFVSDEQRQKCKAAFDRGIDCILNCQINVNGQLTVWCQQHDEKTLAPAGGRAYELPSLCGEESADIALLLMRIEHPSERVRQAVDAAAAWYENSKIIGKRLKYAARSDAPRGQDYVILDDPSAPPMWARFYDLKTNRPFFCSRDGIARDSVAQISVERRTGYAWYGTWGDAVAKAYEAWKTAIASSPDIVVAADGSGQFKTVQQAVESIPKNNRQRTVILIKDGVYHEKVRIDASFVTLRGQSREGTRIEFSQLNDDFTRKPDNLGPAVVNINGSDTVLDNLTVKNTAGIIGPHEFAVYGTGDRVVTTNCDLLSEGADTVSLWCKNNGKYYQARCNLRGAVDFVCPRGWCYIVDSHFFETKDTAAIWHDGSRDKEMKFVLRDCQFDGPNGWYLARHHHDAQFFLLDCTFAKTMIDQPSRRVVYPLDATPPTDADVQRNKSLDSSNIWGERAYYENCHRIGGDYPWFADNLSTAPGAPKPQQITARWTFADKWDPENKIGPSVRLMQRRDRQFVLTFTEEVTVKGNPRLILEDGTSCRCAGGSGTAILLFEIGPDATEDAKSMDLNGGAIIASQASAFDRHAELALPELSW